MYWYRNPKATERPKPMTILNRLCELDVATQLNSKDEGLTRLGDPLTTSEHLYTDLQDLYIATDNLNLLPWCAFQCYLYYSHFDNHSYMAMYLDRHAFISMHASMLRICVNLQQTCSLTKLKLRYRVHASVLNRSRDTTCTPIISGTERRRTPFI